MSDNSKRIAEIVITVEGNGRLAIDPVYLYVPSPEVRALVEGMMWIAQQRVTNGLLTMPTGSTKH